MKKEYEILMAKGNSDILFVKKVKNDKKIEKDFLLFHLQQAAEKFIKSLISFNGFKFPFTHDIKTLIDLCNKKNIELPDYVSKIIILTPFAIEYRYSFSVKDIDVAEFYKLVNKLKNYVQKTFKDK